MTTLSKIRELLGLPLTTLYAEARLEDGRVLVTEAEAFEPGVEVAVIDESGTAVPLDPGSYTTDDGTTYEVAEDSRLALAEEEEAVVEEELSKDKPEEEYMAEDKVLDILKAAFPGIEEEQAMSVARMIADAYAVPAEVAAPVEEVEASEEKVEEMSAVAKEMLSALEELSGRLDALESAPAANAVVSAPTPKKKTELSGTQSYNAAMAAYQSILSNQ